MSDEWNAFGTPDRKTEVKKEIFDWNKSPAAKENGVKIVDVKKDNFKNLLLIILTGFLIGFGVYLYLANDGIFTPVTNQTCGSLTCPSCPSLNCPNTPSCPTSICNCPNITMPNKFYMITNSS